MKKVPYTQKDTEYLFRVAGKVPVEIMAQQLKRTKASVNNFCKIKCISVRVSNAIMEKYYPEIIELRRVNRERKCGKMSAYPISTVNTPN